MIIRLTLLCLSVLLTSCGGEQEPPRHDASSPPAEAAELIWTAPEGWIEEEPNSGLRLAQYRLPKVEGDKEDASARVFYVEETKGTVEANLNRWYGQFVQPDGKSSASVVKVDRSEHNGLSLTTVDLSGTFRQTTTPMGPTSVEKPDYRMLAAVFENEGGCWFVRLIGPRDTVGHWEKSFYEFVKSVELDT